MNYFSANSKSPELQYPTLKFEDVGGNEETLTVSTRWNPATLLFQMSPGKMRMAAVL